MYIVSYIPGDELGNVVWICKKGNVFPVLFFFNWAPHNGGVLGEWRYSSTHSWPRN